ncbi:MAG: hypothetical protein MUD12_15065 [Spirochaetes bacterium]|jgi:hypothetical protein|nr:hypothetical protein [Spirochaetota bacterium]
MKKFATVIIIALVAFTFGFVSCSSEQPKEEKKADAKDAKKADAKKPAPAPAKKTK